MPSVSIDDIQVFIPTYNRPEMLRLTIESVLAQTSGVPPVAVLDNGSFSSTKEVLQQFSGHEIPYYNSSSLGRWGNFILSQKILSRKYLLLLHDDDLLHPEYLQLVLDVVNAHPDATLVTCSSMPWAVGTKCNGPEHLRKDGCVFSQSEFALFSYIGGGRVSFSLSVYKAETFKKINMLDHWERYGKWGDRPLMIEAVGNGVAIKLADRCGWAGVHPGQDGVDSSNLPMCRAWISWEKLFCIQLGDNPFTLSGLSFCLRNYRSLKAGYRRTQKEMPFSQYLREARISGASTMRSSVARYFPLGLVRKIFIWSLRRRLRKAARPLI